MSAPFLSISLHNTVTRKSQIVSLPRDMTIAELQKLAPGKHSVTFVFDGCTPAGSTTLADLDVMAPRAAGEPLKVVFTPQVRMGCPCVKSESW